MQFCTLAKIQYNLMFVSSWPKEATGQHQGGDKRQHVSWSLTMWKKQNSRM